MGWRAEIDDQHRYLEALFLGSETSLDRAEQSFHADYTFVGPNGETADRRATLEMLRQGIGHTSQLTLTVSDHRLLFESDEIVVAEFVERHDLARGANERRCTVVFVVDAAGPNGLRWLRTHESWIRRVDD